MQTFRWNSNKNATFESQVDKNTIFNAKTHKSATLSAKRKDYVNPTYIGRNTYALDLPKCMEMHKTQ